MKYSRTLDKVLAALAFQVEGNHVQAARFFASAASASDVTSVIASLEKQSQAAFAGVQTAKEKPSLAKLLATAKKPTKKVVKAETEEMMSEDDMDDVLDDMTASEEEDEISLEDLNDAAVDCEDEEQEEGVEEMPEATVAEDCDDLVEDAKMAKVTANLAALDRLKKTVKAKSK